MCCPFENVTARRRGSFTTISGGAGIRPVLQHGSAERFFILPLAFRPQGGRNARGRCGLTSNPPSTEGRIPPAAEKPGEPGSRNRNHDRWKFMAKSITISTFIVLCTWTTAWAEPALQLSPATIDLRGREDSQRLIAVTANNGQSTKQVDAIELKSSDPAIVEIRGSTLIPKGDGEATITATSEGQTATATVKVTGIGEPHAWSFRHDVEPLFAKLGCNYGACHGAARRQRRVSIEPTRLRRGGRSFPHYARSSRAAHRTWPIRAQPAAHQADWRLAHKGGVRFEVDEEPYKIIGRLDSTRRRTAARRRRPRDADLTVLPEQSLLGERRAARSAGAVPTTATAACAT